MALGDKLRETKGDEKIKRANCAILDKMEVLRKEIESLRHDMRHITRFGLPKEDKRIIVIEHNGDRFTENDLIAMSDVELKDLRERLYMTMYRAGKRAHQKKSKPATRAENAKKAVIKQKEIEIIDRIKESRDIKGS